VSQTIYVGWLESIGPHSQHHSFTVRSGQALLSEMMELLEWLKVRPRSVSREPWYDRTYPRRTVRDQWSIIRTS